MCLEPFRVHTSIPVYQYTRLVTKPIMQNCVRQDGLYACSKRDWVPQYTTLILSESIRLAQK